MDAATLKILIDIQARLDQLAKAEAGLRSTRQEAQGLGNIFSQGLGIGSGMAIVQTTIATIREAVTMSSVFAAEAQRYSARLNLSGEAAQTFSRQARAANVDFQQMISGLATYRATLGSALLDPTKGTALTALGLDAQRLSQLPLERQLEQIATSLGHVTDENVRMRLAQDLFGRSASLVQTLLQDLRKDGYDKLRDSAAAAGAILDERMTAALDRAGNAAEDAQRKLSIALAPTNLSLLKWKTGALGLLTDNAGPISSGIQAMIVGAVIGGLQKAGNSVAAKGGGDLVAGFQTLGTKLGASFGVAFAAVLGAFIISEIERRIVEANNRMDAFDERAHATPREIQRALPGVQSEGELRDLYNKAVTAYQRAQIERKKVNFENGTDEQKSQLQSLNQEIEALEKLIPLIKEKGQAYLDANRAAHVDFSRLAEAQTDLFVIETNHANFQNSTRHTDEEKRAEELQFLSDRIRLLREIHDLTEKLPLGQGETAEQRNLDLKKIEAEIAKSGVRKTDIMIGPSQADQIERQYNTFAKGQDSSGARLLSPGQGLTAGLQSWAMSAGSSGQQIADALQNTVGSAIGTLSDGIVGLITKTKSWGDVGRAAGMMFLQTLVQVAVQMIAQKAIMAMLTAFHVANEGLKTTATVSGAATRTAATATESGTSLVHAAIEGMESVASIPYVGPILAIAAMAAILAAGYALLKGHAVGGYTADVAPNQPAGVVHGGEWVAPAWQVDHPVYGPQIAGLEAARQGHPGFMGGGLFGLKWGTKLLLTGIDQNLVNYYRMAFGHSDTKVSVRKNAGSPLEDYSAIDNYGVAAATAGAGGYGGAGGSGSGSGLSPMEATPMRVIVFTDNMGKARALMRDPEWQGVFINTARATRGSVFLG